VDLEFGAAPVLFVEREKSDQFEEKQKQGTI
jgi:hypothetical protein